MDDIAKRLGEQLISAHGTLTNAEARKLVLAARKEVADQARDKAIRDAIARLALQTRGQSGLALRQHVEKFMEWWSKINEQ